MNKLKQFRERHFKKLAIAASAVLFIIAIINLIYQFEVNVTSNDECLWVPKTVGKDSVVVRFDVVKVDGVAWKAGIRDGDILLFINNVPAKNTNLLQTELNKFEEGKYAPYVIKKPDGRIVETKVEIKKLLSFPQLGLALLGLFWFIIGFIVVMAKPDGHIQKLFYLIGACFVLCMTAILLDGNTPTSILYILDFLWSLAACFVPFLLVKFFWLFPKPFGFMEKKKITRRLLFYIPLSIFVITYFYRVFTIYGIGDQTGQKFYFPFIVSLIILLMIATIISLVSLFISYFRLKNKEDRKPLFVILFAYSLAIASVFYVNFVAPAISDTIFNSPEYYAPAILIVLLPVAFGYSIFRYQLMDVSVVIKNTIMYGLATISITVIYFLIIYIIGQTVGSVLHTEYQTLVAGVVFIVFAVVFQSTKDKFHDFLTAKFYPEQFAYQKVLVSFINDISIPQDAPGFEPILDSMKRTFVQALMLEQFGIMIKDNKNESSFRLERSEGIKNANLEVHPGGLTEFIEAKQLVNKQPVIERDDFDKVFPENAEELRQENIYTIIPMIVKSKPIGLLLFGLKHSGSQFAGKDLELLNAAAGQSAISIENARLYKSETEKLKIDRDLDLARKIQEGLLPKCIPSMQGLDICGEMIPAMQVGGDYYDLIPISESKLFVVVGDVSGKGLSASLYMTKLQTMMQLSCVPGRSPKEVLVEINRRMYESIEKSWFVTMTLALFDIETNTVRFCRAGHVPVMISKNGTVELHKTQGIGVGLEKGIIFERTLVEQEIELIPGQIYIFYSDGVSEAMNEKQDLYGEEKLTSLMKNKTDYRASQIVQNVWDELSTYRGAAEQNDDMTLVVVKVNDLNGNVSWEGVEKCETRA